MLPSLSKPLLTGMGLPVMLAGSLILWINRHWGGLAESWVGPVSQFHPSIGQISVHSHYKYTTTCFPESTRIQCSLKHAIHTFLMSVLNSHLQSV